MGRKDDYWNLIWVSTIVFCGNPVEIHENRPDTKKKMPKVKSCFYLMYHFIFLVSLIASIVHRRLDSSSG